jgi:5-methylcytosine-specific restriction endonuclease McrBC regulatory subunit McrC
MYQLYAYGQKYRLGESKERSIEVTPKLVLLYPYSEKFTKELPAFIYDDMDDGLGLKLTAIPFNLADPNTYQAQIENIIKLVKES